MLIRKNKKTIKKKTIRNVIEAIIAKNEIVTIILVKNAKIFEKVIVKNAKEIIILIVKQLIIIKFTNNLTIFY